MVWLKSPLGCDTIHVGRQVSLLQRVCCLKNEVAGSSETLTSHKTVILIFTIVKASVLTGHVLCTETEQEYNGMRKSEEKGPHILWIMFCVTEDIWTASGKSKFQTHISKKAYSFKSISPT
jgi:hypothetical protein